MRMYESMNKGAREGVEYKGRVLLSLQLNGVRVKGFLPAPAATQPQEWPLSLPAPMPPVPGSTARIILCSRQNAAAG